MTMPVMGGVETLRQLRTICPDVCVILSSGYSETQAIQRFAGRGIAGFLQKPYTPVQLAAKIKEFICP
jgi:two-component system cell cycle sensor histidine kinase/response regulator CckA